VATQNLKKTVENGAIPTTHEGAPTVKVNAEETLRRTVMACGEVISATDECKKLTIQVCRKLYEENNLYPKLVLPSIECGIYLTYTNGKYKLTIEVYNDLDITAVVSDDTIIHSAIIGRNGKLLPSLEECLKYLRR